MYANGEVSIVDLDGEETFIVEKGGGSRGLKKYLINLIDYKDYDINGISYRVYDNGTVSIFETGEIIIKSGGLQEL